MNSGPSYYDAAIIGGGLAGLTAAIQIIQNGFSVAVFEKENYPFHKVCGEYISLESWDFLESLGLPLDKWDLPRIDTLQLSATNGNLLQQRLPLGGFGISRYCIDNEMMRLARQKGVVIFENAKVHEVQFTGEGFIINTAQMEINARACCGTFGKRSNLDVKWKRPFTQQKQVGVNNFIGVKYHTRHDHPRNIIALHNFKHGYCGVAAIEGDQTNICYLTTAQNLRDHNNDLRAMEENILYKNPFLKKIFSEADFLYDKPLTISQISFEKKEQVCDHVLLTGDAAGMIAPLCGNGMSMAIMGSRIATKYMIDFLQKNIDRSTMELAYANEWRRSFSSRLRAGRIIQHLFGHQWVTNAAINMLKPFPPLSRMIIRHTHG